MPDGFVEVVTDDVFSGFGSALLISFPVGKELPPFDEAGCKAEEHVLPRPEVLALLVKPVELLPFDAAGFKAEELALFDGSGFTAEALARFDVLLACSAFFPGRSVHLASSMANYESHKENISRQRSRNMPVRPRNKLCRPHRRVFATYLQRPLSIQNF